MISHIIFSLKKIMGSPIAKSITKKLNPKSIERLLSICVGIANPNSITEKMNAKIMSKLTKEAAKKFGIDEELLKEGLRDPYYRRGLANVIKGIAEFGITLPQKLYAPFLVVWNFTYKCNLKCKHCYANAGREGDELKLEEKFDVVDQLDDAGVVALSFSGGEPLLHEHFLDVVKYSVKKGFHTSIATNGTLITPNVAKRLKEIGVDYVEVSLDASKPEIHDVFRGVKGAFSKALNGIKNCLNEGLEVGIATTSTKLNLYDIPNIIDLGIKLRVRRIVVFNFIPSGRGREIKNLDLDVNEMKWLLEYLYDRLDEGKIQVFSTSPTYAVVAVKRCEQNKGRKIAPTHFTEVCLPTEGALILSEFIGGCGAGRLYCGINPNGDITPCVFMPIIVGNVKDGFLKVWQESEILNLLRDRDNERYACKDCEYRYICGGCRARAYGYYDDLLAFDPGCHIRREVLKVTL
ncbi:radical SAM/SPASM domain-containing protein [Archaeoglobales archaeon]|nr:MAG: radical SAM/SPASM domain-containing protein [Archaeoglobales archaeon]